MTLMCFHVSQAMQVTGIWVSKNFVHKETYQIIGVIQRDHVNLCWDAWCEANPDGTYVMQSKSAEPPGLSIECNNRLVNSSRVFPYLIALRHVDWSLAAACSPVVPSATGVKTKHKNSSLSSTTLQPTKQIQLSTEKPKLQRIRRQTVLVYLPDFCSRDAK